ncbi:MAG: twin-arginine translocase TatA/TatE family subunit [Atopobiaceae bacterium]|nr:twin-arginine translocase TatA/TatE family subunit [Atopobiaceae bacterium]MBQ6411832.1 twin-arginine translocase TatA/TatE family subunit [Atopobiaceae bacterium]MBQ6650263.1 twin-arginine translocase TatA/TatE family subunit [Atopobiaceae bacterium]MBR3383950.1 twin-arginine translocase TatA/TatE family subunit [Atopobiaceae bacterium]
MVLGLGPLELVVILLVVLVIFGPKNLPKLGSAMGKTVKNIREGMEDDEAPKADAEPEPVYEDVAEEEVDEEAAAEEAARKAAKKAAKKAKKAAKKAAEAAAAAEAVEVEDAE